MDISTLSEWAEIYLVIVLSVGLWYLRQLAKRVTRVGRALRDLQEEQVESSRRAETRVRA